MEYHAIPPIVRMQQRNIVSQNIRRIHRKVCAIRKSEKAGMRYMQRWEEIAYARAEGKAGLYLGAVGGHRAGSVVSAKGNHGREQPGNLDEVAAHGSPGREQ